MFHWKYLRGKGRPGRLGSSVAALALGAIGLWSFSRCAALPDDRCLDDGIHSAVGRIIPSEDACMTCYCDATAELHCVSTGCATPDGGLMTNVLE
jgi:hypothetical protein